MYTFLIVVIVIAALLLGLVVLMQNSKGGGLSSTFSSSSQIMGVRKTADFLEKATWVLAITIVVLSFFSGFFVGSGKSGGEPQQQGSKASQAQSADMPMPTAAPAAPAGEENGLGE
jgi:preprotein translocase subunit SecG